MRKIVLAILSILICSNIAAQMPMGGGGRPQGGPRGGRPPMHGNYMKAGESDVMLMNIPDIPNLTLDQREKLSKAISNERKDIAKLMDEKQELRMKSENPGISEKERQKVKEKISKTDDKIRKQEEKYNNKYRSILSPEQYEIFIAKKKSIEFKGFGRQPGNQRPPRHPDNRERPEMPNENGF